MADVTGQSFVAPKASGRLSEVTDMRISSAALTFVAVLAASSATGCASGAKRELFAARLDASRAERERAVLELHLQQTTAALQVSQAQLREAQAQQRVSAESLEQQRSQARVDIEQSRSQATGLSSSLAACESRRLQLENANVGILDRDLRLCQESQPRVFDQGVTKGQLTVLETLQVIGTSEQNCGMTGLFCDYFYRFEVRVGPRTFVLTRIQTQRAEAPLGTALSAVSGLAQTVAGLAR